MSARLGAALAAYVRQLAPPGSLAYLVVEGVSESTAAGMATQWDAGMPRLAIASKHPARFGDHAIRRGVTATMLRNAGALCLVLCRGTRVADSQGVRTFHSVNPSVLLDDTDNLLLLAKAHPPAAGPR